MDKPFAITLDVGSSLANKTGSWRTFRPVYLDRMPPCNNQCPAGENIQAWLYYAEEGRYEEAWRKIMEENPFPAVMGRVCYHTCESACNRAKVDESVGINGVERFLGDQAIKYEWKVTPGEPTGRKVLVVGAGPAGLTCAYHLARLGHAATVIDAAPKAGGMLRYGIPKYRMPREKLNAEIQRIAEMGVEIRLSTRIDDLAAEMKRGGYDAAFVAAGAQLGRMVGLPGADRLPVLDAVQILRQLELEEPVPLRGRVIVYGGGNTAFDVARSAVRLGAIEALVVYRRTQDKMPAHPSEIKEAIEEGVTVRCLSTIVRVGESSIAVERMELDEKGNPQPTGEIETLPATSVVLALGQDADLGFLGQVEGLDIEGGMVKVDRGMATGVPGVFAGGDMVPSDRNATVAIGHGKKAARHIDAYLRGVTLTRAPKHEIASHDKMNAWYYSDAPRSIRPILEAVRRTSGFAEVVGDYDDATALYEARRCMSCGNCFECDNCYGVCPDNAVIKLGPGNRFQFNYDYCKGCGICVSECPCGAIKMVPETI
jgi:2-oxoacid:acceptor oxidoreductase delta subunit (pyruvate/2-ketoisovalerate family)